MGAIRSHWEERNASPGEVFVPEWGMRFFVGPITVGQYQRLAAAESEAERNLLTIEVLAKDEKGFPALRGDDLDDLKKYGTADVVPRVAGELLNAAPGLDPEKKA